MAMYGHVSVPLDLGQAEDVNLTRTVNVSDLQSGKYSKPGAGFLGSQITC
jgi:hypothetical protein